jgi:hypothetical protein
MSSGLAIAVTMTWWLGSGEGWLWYIVIVLQLSVSAQAHLAPLAGFRALCHVISNQATTLLGRPILPTVLPISDSCLTRGILYYGFFLMIDW